MKFYENTKAVVRSPDGYIGIFDIVAVVWRWDTLALFSIFSLSG